MRKGSITPSYGFLLGAFQRLQLIKQLVSRIAGWVIEVIPLTAVPASLFQPTLKQHHQQLFWRWRQPKDDS
jgi:hypothetical protein